MVILTFTHHSSRIRIFDRPIYKECRIAVDNLETVRDFQLLVPYLERMATPAKFLLTSREHVPSLTAVKRISYTIHRLTSTFLRAEVLNWK